MDDKIYCKECCKEISEDTSKEYKGYCKSCYNEKYNSYNDDSNLNTYHRISILYFILVIVSSIIVGYNTYDEFKLSIMLTVFFAGFISFFIFFMLATIIEELRNLQK